jgi:hypothetical protein
MIRGMLSTFARDLSEAERTDRRDPHVVDGRVRIQRQRLAAFLWSQVGQHREGSDRHTGGALDEGGQRLRLGQLVVFPALLADHDAGSVQFTDLVEQFSVVDHMAEPSSPARSWGAHSIALDCVDKVIDPVDEPSQDVASEERAVTGFGAHRKGVVELVRERPPLPAIVSHSGQVARAWLCRR